ncbi:hypothetical protein MRB53_012362 [Persea americana]|uniref:Uncharacterized protein n=1 Tax=Persea americana TaxID=3435 RepID=A0ACC2LXG7_PERAE|nr:hypothetical protein MRB53_012362 [Persea americana]
MGSESSDFEQRVLRRVKSSQERRDPTVDLGDGGLGNSLNRGSALAFFPLFMSLLYSPQGLWLSSMPPDPPPTPADPDLQHSSSLLPRDPPPPQADPSQLGAPISVAEVQADPLSSALPSCPLPSDQIQTLSQPFSIRPALPCWFGSPERPGEGVPVSKNIGLPRTSASHFPLTSPRTPSSTLYCTVLMSLRGNRPSDLPATHHPVLQDEHPRGVLSPHNVPANTVSHDLQPAPTHPPPPQSRSTDSTASSCPDILFLSEPKTSSSNPLHQKPDLLGYTSFFSNSPLSSENPSIWCFTKFSPNISFSLVDFSTQHLTISLSSTQNGPTTYISDSTPSNREDECSHKNNEERLSGDLPEIEILRDFVKPQPFEGEDLPAWHGVDNDTVEHHEPCSPTINLKENHSPTTKELSLSGVGSLPFPSHSIPVTPAEGRRVSDLPLPSHSHSIPE